MLFLPILHDGEGFELEDPKPRSSDPGRGGCRTELPPGRRVAKRASRGLRLTALAALAIGFTGVSGTASMPVREHCGPDGHRLSKRRAGIGSNRGWFRSPQAVSTGV